MSDFRTPAGAALVARLKAFPPVVALIPKASVYDEIVPAGRTFPFSRLGAMIETPLRSTGLSASAFNVMVQGFSKDVTDPSGATIQRAKDGASKIGSAFKDALERAELPMTIDGQIYRARCTWLQTTTMMDGDEAGAWMVTSTFSIEISG